MKKMLKMLSFVVIALLAVSMVSALTVTTKLDEDELDAKNGVNFLDVEKGDEFTLKVILDNDGAGSTDLKNVVVTAEVLGYEHGDVESLYASSDVFSLDQNATHKERLKFRLPKRLDSDRYTLTVRVGSRDGTLFSQTYELGVDGKRHDLAIDDVVFSPAFNVQSGRALLATVRVENFGEKDEEGVKVALTLPALNVGDAKYIDEVEEDEEVTSEELFVRVPACAAPGDYKATVTLSYNDGHDTTTKDYTVTVTDGGLCNTAAAPTESAQSAGKTIITVAGEAQEVAKGTSGAVYPLTLTNTGSAAKTYTVSATAGEWANVQVSPSNVVVLNGGESKAVFVHVAASDSASAGEQVFSVAVKSGETTLKELVLKANVTGAAKAAGYGKVKRGLEVGLVVLVVLLVILGLVIGFNRLKEGGDDEEGQTYY